jgi:fimbrial chaperone protein
MKSLRLMLALLLVLAGVHSACAADAGGFAAVVSPPRFELKSKAGTTLRQVFELTNRSIAPAKFRIHTADFSLEADYSVAFQDALQPNSCRPWVALERPEAALPGGGTMRYRFEVQVPADAPAGECRFGILIEGEDPSTARAGDVAVPIAGRIGIIVYVIIGDAKPQIEVFGPQVVKLNGQSVPSLRVHNAGNAHARMGGFLSGTDAKGVKYDFNPSTLPILPGEERRVFLMPSLPGNDHPTLAFPVSVHGSLEWGDQSIELNEHFE